MGGSAIAGDLVGNLLEAETDSLLSVLRTPHLPRGFGATVPTVFISYSGNTWETLSAYEAAAARGVPRVVISSGGQLADMARRDRIPWVPVPVGLPPRAAVGYLLGGLLALLDGLFPKSNAPRLTRAVRALRDSEARLTGTRGLPHRVARQIGPRTPFIYSEVGLSGIAHRWKTQFEENAKRLAIFDTVPELFHNALVPWSAAERRKARQNAVVIVEWSEQDRRVEARFRYLEHLLKERGVSLAKVPLSSPDRLEAILMGSWIGDFASLALAESAQVDPLEVRAIEEMKRRLANR